MYASLFLAGREHTVSGKVGESVVLPCEVDSHNCGRIYVITWTKHIGEEWRRVYLYSDTHSKPMNAFAGRAHFVLHNNSNAELHLRSLSVSDEGTYKCDVTYVHGKCPSLTFTKLYTLSECKPLFHPPVSNIFLKLDTHGEIAPSQMAWQHSTPFQFSAHSFKWVIHRGSVQATLPVTSIP
ncbi:hypothetical protein AVEN_169167-1 [Araneus ventricosus]|uniref:Ig-like domain-containing protein n=1 Tax=Araneus ventricosus TaxID=182803 RepID=A0A4Y2KB68_ARAVE|nr:hypothetical protein AVEN_169167-1 [Araneus ventricosus]